MLSDKVPSAIREVFFGASLIALRKKDGGVRPIAVGGTLRQLVAKVASRSVHEEIGEMFAPHHLGFGVPQGVEAAVYTARHFVDGLDATKVFLKLDVKNAFNSIRIWRDKILDHVLAVIPQLHPFVYASYSTPSILLFGDNIIISAEGSSRVTRWVLCFFCLALQPVLQMLQAEFKFSS